jgi:hypothetical protein
VPQVFSVTIVIIIVIVIIIIIIIIITTANIYEKSSYTAV